MAGIRGIRWRGPRNVRRLCAGHGVAPVWRRHCERPRLRRKPRKPANNAHTSRQPPPASRKCVTEPHTATNDSPIQRDLVSLTQKHLNLPDGQAVGITECVPEPNNRPSAVQRANLAVGMRTPHSANGPGWGDLLVNGSRSLTRVAVARRRGHQLVVRQVARRTIEEVVDRIVIVVLTIRLAVVEPLKAVANLKVAIG